MYTNSIILCDVIFLIKVKFPDAGQNIYYSSWSQKRPKDKTKLIGEAIQAWWDEHKDFYINEVDKYEGQSRG